MKKNYTKRQKYNLIEIDSSKLAEVEMDLFKIALDEKPDLDLKLVLRKKLSNNTYQFEYLEYTYKFEFNKWRLATC